MDPNETHVHSMVEAKLILLLLIDIVSIKQAMSRENLYSGFSTRSDTNQAVQAQKMVRRLKLRIKEAEGLY